MYSPLVPHKCPHAADGLNAMPGFFATAERGRKKFVSVCLCGFSTMIPPPRPRWWDGALWKVVQSPCNPVPGTRGPRRVPRDVP